MDTSGREIAQTERDRAARVEALAARSAKLDPQHRALVEEVLESSFVAVEELQVAGEELRQQNEELIAVHNDLQASRRRYQDLFESAPDGYLVTDPAGVIRQANQAAVELLGVRRAVLQDKPLVGYVAEEDRAEFQRRMDRVRAGQNPGGAEWELRVRNRARESGAVFPAALTVSPIRDAQGALVGLRWLLRDISPSKRTEERDRLLEEARVAAQEAQAANTLLRTLLETMPVGVVACDAQGAILMNNTMSERILGERVWGDVERPRRDYVPYYPDGAPFSPQEMPLARALKQGQVIRDVEILIHRADGETRTILAGAAPVRDGTGEIVSGVTVFQDITERKRAEQTLRRYADRLRALHETDRAILAARSVDEIAEAALAGVPQLLDCVRASVMLYDLDQGEMSLLAVRASGETRVGKGWRSAIDEQWAPMVEDLMRGATVTLEDVQQAPSHSPWREALREEQVKTLVAMPLRIEGQLLASFNLGMARPGLLREEERAIAREVATQLAIGMRQVRLYERIRRHAEQLEDLVQERTAELRASQARLQAIFDHATIGIALLDLEGRLLDSNPALQALLGYDAQALRGRHFKAFTHPDDIEADLALAAELIAGQRDFYSLEKRLVRKDGQIVWVNLHTSVIRDAEGELQYGLRLVDDITERKQAQEALIQSEKLAMTGQLAASLAHEINNPLQSVLGCLGLAQEILEDQGLDGELGQFIGIAHEELQRAARIVGRLRDLSRPSDADNKARVDVNDLIARVLALSAKRLERHHIVALQRLADDLPQPQGVADQIQQVFLNLALNAIDAMPEGGELRISTGYEQASDEIVVTFVDTGPGMSPDVLSKLFEPFFSTKNEGVGLGLFVSQNIVREHGGGIEAESELGQGSTFVVRLPA